MLQIFLDWDASPRPPLIDAKLSQSNILAKKFVITQMGISYTVQESAASVVGDNHQALEG